MTGFITSKELVEINLNKLCKVVSDRLVVHKNIIILTITKNFLLQSSRDNLNECLGWGILLAGVEV